MNYFTENSYMTKEEFINMLQGLRFERVKNANIEVITGFDDDTPRGYKIDLI